jgi:hypothetical protein
VTSRRVYLDPTAERSVAERPRAKRPASLAGRTVALVDIAKPRGDVFLDRLAERLAAERVRIVRFSKPTFTKPAPIDLRQQIATQCDVVIQALAD